MTLSEREREVIAHALGLPRHPRRNDARARRWACRNYFAAGPDDLPVWRSLVRRGLATTLCPIDSARLGCPGFAVTLAGAQAAGLAGYVPSSLIKKRAKP